MHLARSILVVSLLLASCSVDRSPPAETYATVKDDLGRSVSLESPPTRIVSLAPNVTEILFALGLDSAVVGVTDVCDYPAAVRGKDRVGGLASPSHEKIVALEPDLVVMTVSGNTREDFDTLVRLGLTVFVIDPRTVEGVFKSIDDLGRLSRKETQADSIVSFLRNKRDALVQRIQAKPKMQTLFLLSLRPIISVSSGTFIDELLQLSSAVNVASGSPTAYPLLNKEEILLSNPEVILVTSDVARSRDDVIRALPEFGSIPAVGRRRIAIIDADLISRPGPRIIGGLEALVNAIHPSPAQNP